MNPEPLVSVVIATYNMGQYVGGAVDSILNQSWQNLEVIVVDDGSTDDTEAQMQRFEGDGRVVYVKTENRKQPKAKNRGLQEARGDFIAFCDADDMWEPEKLAHQIPAFEDPEVGVVYSSASAIDENGRVTTQHQGPVPDRPSGYITDQLITHNCVPFGTAVIRRQAVEDSGMFDESIRMGIDWDLWLRYSIKWKFHHVPERLYIYRVWSGQMSNDYRGRYDHASRILNNFLERHPDAVSEKLARRARASNYAGRARAIASVEGTRSEPLSLVYRALRTDPTFFNAWKLVARILIGGRED